MSDVFTFTPKGGEPRTLELRISTVQLVVTDGAQGAPSVGVALSLQGTQPGMTMDDRGVTGWDSPVGIDVTFFGDVPIDAALPDVSFQSSQAAEHCEKFLYYWDHSDIHAIDAKIEGTGPAQITLTMTLASGEGDVALRCTVPVNQMRIKTYNADRKDALAARARKLMALDTLPEWKERFEEHYMLVAL